jgi:hypothetical protein
MRIRSRVPVAFVVVATGLTAVAVVGPHLGTGGAAVAVAATQASAAAATVPYAPYPATGTELYVDNASASNCSDSGAGSQSQPLCTIAAAASAVQPGQTVIVEPGVYPSVTLSVAGTPDAPITFTAIKGATVNASASGSLVTLSGAHNVVLNGFITSGPQQGSYVTGGSSGITINGGSALGGSVPSIEVDGTSSGVTVSRMAVNSRKPIQVDSGASGVVITGNTLRSFAVGDWGVLATDAHGIDVTGNTIHGLCSGGISIVGASSGVTVENNIVQSESSTCPTGTAVSVSEGSEAGTVVGYNLIDPLAGGSLYSWGGTSYTSLAGFPVASGQGAHDIVADPGLGKETSGGWPLPSQFWYPLTATSPAVDSADPDAPGALPTDQFGNPRADDPSLANSGSGSYDRGAFELEGGLAGAPGVPFASVVSSGPLTATFTLNFKPAWTSNGPTTILELLFGAGTPTVITRATSVQHAFATAGLYTMDFMETAGYFATSMSTREVVVGAHYTPVTRFASWTPAPAPAPARPPRSPPTGH